VFEKFQKFNPPKLRKGVKIWVKSPGEFKKRKFCSPKKIGGKNFNGEPPQKCGKGLFKKGKVLALSFKKVKPFSPKNKG